ncbi:MAG: hypothetical protein ACFCU7_09750 [Pleurocapsa sp.]
MKIINSISKFWQKLVSSLITQRHEPQIEQKHDQDGNLYWQAYDFATNKSYTFISEHDVRVWIEDRYHCC